MPTCCATRFGACMNDAAPLEDPALPALASGRHDALAAALARLGLRGARTVALLKHHPGSRCTLAVAAGTDRYAAALLADRTKLHAPSRHPAPALLRFAARQLLFEPCVRPR